MVDIILIMFAFSAGAIAFLNPCGFAMLPTYVSYFIERNTQLQWRNVSISDNNFSSSLGRIKSIFIRRLSYGLMVGILVTAGFIAIFGLTGIGISAAGMGIVKFFPWIAVLSGSAIIGIGIVKLFGKTLHTNIPRFKGITYDAESNNMKLSKGKTRNYLTFFLFGIGYSIASLSCTLPIFILIVFQGLSAGGIIDGSIVFLSYALGMGVIMIAVSLAISISNQTLFVKWLTTVAPKMNFITSIVLILAGSYLIYYNLIIGKLA